MQRYKSIFSESSVRLVVSNQREAQQIVDISNLIWKDAFASMSWYAAINSAPSGYRLPTIQELYTACVEIPDFKKNKYWSATSDFPDNNSAWFMSFKDKKADTTSKNYEGNVSVFYVKEI